MRTLALDSYILPALGPLHPQESSKVAQEVGYKGR